MGTLASQITCLTIVFSNVHSVADQRKHQSSASLAFVRGIHRWPVNSPHQGPVTRKVFPLMTSSCNCDFFINFTTCDFFVSRRDPVIFRGSSSVDSLWPSCATWHLTQHWFRPLWLVPCSVPNHYVNIWRLIAKRTLRNKLWTIITKIL